MANRRRGPALPALVAAVLALVAAGACTPFWVDDERTWLCRPGEGEDVCGQRGEPAHDVDCFYVYPTVSADQRANSDLDPGEREEIAVTARQAAPLADRCNVFAPMYRQMTGVQLLAAGLDEEALDDAYADLRQAWDEYVQEERDAERPVVLFGHSQGAAMLERLLEDEEVRPALEQRLVSAYLVGWPATVPGVAPCSTPGETGCLISYSAFSVDDPPVASFFGRPADDDGPVVCTNPADLAGGPAPLHPSLPGAATARCVDQNGFRYLEVTMDDALAAAVGPPSDDDWGLHHADLALAEGDLVALLDAQLAAYPGAG